ncbi:MAG: hypothetical protein NZM25_00300 [Leptospiraceae bacterium]|nr:hypothetical protein [Leptospiraceae bacterium]MDW8306166.1 hypothetical protein [Leptospiraceae bacterium]
MSYIIYSTTSYFLGEIGKEIYRLEISHASLYVFCVNIVTEEKYTETYSNN